MRAWDRRSWLRRAGLGGLAALTLACNGASGAGPGGKGGRGGKGRGGGHGGPGGPGGQAPLAVELVSLEAATIERHYRASGTLEALRRAEIRPVRSGIIDTLEAEIGDRVEDGQTLARLDARELSLAARRDKITASNAERELARLEKLANSGAIAQEELDARRYELETAKASARLSRTQAGSMTVRAPFAGTIVAREVDVGNLASTSTVIYEVADLSALELPLHLPEREAARVAVEAEVEIELVDGSTFTGTVVRRAPVVDPLTGTVEFVVRAESFPALAVPGAFVRAKVLLERRDQVQSLPRTALFELEDKRYVYVMRERKARRVAVEVGLEGSERAELLSGLEPGDRVLQDAQGITEGMPVKPAGEPDPEPPPGEGKADKQDGKRRRGGWGGRKRRH